MLRRGAGRSRRRRAVRLASTGNHRAGQRTHGRGPVAAVGPGVGRPGPGGLPRRRRRRGSGHPRGWTPRGGRPAPRRRPTARAGGGSTRTARPRGRPRRSRAQRGVPSVVGVRLLRRHPQRPEIVQQGGLPEAGGPFGGPAEVEREPPRQVGHALRVPGRAAAGVGGACAAARARPGRGPGPGARRAPRPRARTRSAGSTGTRGRARGPWPSTAPGRPAARGRRRRGPRPGRTPRPRR